MKARLSKLLVVLVVSVILVLATGAVAYAATVDEIAKQLICQCGCNSLLSNCVHGECMVRDTMTTVIAQRLDRGDSAEQIIQFFVAQYGEQVLASPPKQGFNLTAWIAPFAAILAGGAIIYLVLKKWVARGRELETTVAVDSGEGDEEYQRLLEKELKEFAEEGFR
ncbi:MAG: cytochrome c-type biogenesis protein CcmH [Chloroflexi bacterium]|nr:cytochrome c-type biogenesis protein CcmH [Chloroflexota bacterium]